jgi:hypothetical protein
MSSQELVHGFSMSALKHVQALLKSSLSTKHNHDIPLFLAALPLDVLSGVYPLMTSR